ncbi:MAG: hypothetical protein ABJK25_03045 [Halieaceae bacterium]
MRLVLLASTFMIVTGCASNQMYYSPYDLNRDGTMDAICPGMEYDPSDRSMYGWRSDGSGECNDRNENS